MKARKKQGWRQNPDAVKADILNVATKLFAQKGVSSTKIDDIAKLTATSKRMIYYYFGDKSGLYQRALEHAFQKVSAQEADFDISGQPPEAALVQLVGFVFDNHRLNPDFVRMVMVENVLHARTLTDSDTVNRINAGAIAQLSEVLSEGQRQGIFRSDICASSLHWAINAMCFFNVSNQPSYSTMFGTDLFGEGGQNRLRKQAVEMVLAYVQVKEGADAKSPPPGWYDHRSRVSQPSD